MKATLTSTHSTKAKKFNRVTIFILLVLGGRHAAGYFYFKLLPPDLSILKLIFFLLALPLSPALAAVGTSLLLRVKLVFSSAYQLGGLPGAGFLRDALVNLALWLIVFMVIARQGSRGLNLLVAFIKSLVIFLALSF